MQPDFMLEGTLKGVTVKANDGNTERLVLTLTGQREDLSDPEIQQAMDTGSVFAKRVLELTVEAGPRFAVGWIAAVAVKAHPEHGTVLTWQVAAEVRLAQVADVLAQLVPKQGAWIGVSGRMPRRQLDLAGITHDAAKDIEAGLKAKGHDVTVEVVRPGGEAA